MLSVKTDKQCSRVGTLARLVGAESKLLLITGTRPPLSSCFIEVATSKFWGMLKIEKKKGNHKKIK